MLVAPICNPFKWAILVFPGPHALKQKHILNDGAKNWECSQARFRPKPIILCILLEGEGGIVSSGMQARALQSHRILVALVARNGLKLCERELAAVSRCYVCIIVLSAWQQGIGIGILVEGAPFARKRFLDACGECTLNIKRLNAFGPFDFWLREELGG